MTDPKKDFRYTMPDGSEIEAFQLTPQSAWKLEDWPPWLQKQTMSGETNRVYRPVGDAGSLYISLSTGEYAIEENAWIMHIGGELNVCSRDQFHPAEKVVPLEVKAVTPAADGFDSDAEFSKTAPVDPYLKVDGPEPVPGIDDLIDSGGLPEAQAVQAIVSTDAEELTEAITKAMAMLQADKPGEALDFLKEGMMLRVNWCNCRPGQCEESEVMGCRVESPLVK